MKDLYDELLEREKYLENLYSKKPTDVNLGKLTELRLVVVRVQQILISEIKK